MPINFFIKSGSIALQIRYRVISCNGAVRAAPPVPNLIDIMPSFFKELRIFRIVTELLPVDNDNNSLVTFLAFPYS